MDRQLGQVRMRHEILLLSANHRHPHRRPGYHVFEVGQTREEKKLHVVPTF